MSEKPKAEDRTFESIAVGETCVRQHTISADTVATFAALSGDFNPLHIDAAYAATTKFKKPVVHGMLLGALVSELVGMHLPGLRCLIVKESLDFKLPVFIGNTIAITATVLHKVESMKLLELDISISRGTDVVVRGSVHVQCL